METDELDDDDHRADDGGIAAYRALADARLDEIAEEVKRRLATENLDIPVSFAVPRSGSSIINFGTSRDLDDPTWRRVRTVVISVVKEAVGILRVRSHENDARRPMTSRVQGSCSLRPTATETSLPPIATKANGEGTSGRTVAPLQRTPRCVPAIR
jgi:hypothetical protein